MALASRAFEALRSGLFVALLAPLVAAAIFLLVVATSGERPEPGIANFCLLFMGIASGAYFLGAVPAFVAGLMLPALRSRLSAVVSALCTGSLGALVYLATFGAHLLSQPQPVRSVLTACVPAFIGTAVASLAVPRRATPCHAVRLKPNLPFNRTRYGSQPCPRCAQVHDAPRGHGRPPSRAG